MQSHLLAEFAELFKFQALGGVFLVLLGLII